MTLKGSPRIGPTTLSPRPGVGDIDDGIAGTISVSSRSSTKKEALNTYDGCFLQEKEGPKKKMGPKIELDISRLRAEPFDLQLFKYLIVFVICS